jgi:hypothetical protein
MSEYLTNQNDPIAAINAGHRWCYTIPDDTAYHDERGFVPSLIVEDLPGHYPMLGNGVGASPWYWGATAELAQATCDRANAERGITPEIAKAIVDSSLCASLRQRR